MRVVALVLFAVFAALGFGWRSWEQRRRTGSTGLLSAIAGHVVARGTLTCTYER